MRAARRRQDAGLLAGAVMAHAALWLFVDSWWLRGLALVATAALWPLMLVLAFDRRPSR